MYVHYNTPGFVIGVVAWALAFLVGYHMNWLNPRATLNHSGWIATALIGLHLMGTIDVLWRLRSLDEFLEPTKATTVTRKGPVVPSPRDPVSSLFEVMMRSDYGGQYYGVVPAWLAAFGVLALLLLQT
jgi:hypothetical protein